MEITGWMKRINSCKQLFSSTGLSDLIQLKLEYILKQGESREGGEQAPTKIPAILPILPLRGLVVYPQTAVPLTIGQPRSIRLVDDVVAGEERLIGLVTSRDPDLETPEPKDLYEIGTVAMVHRLFRAPDGTIRLLVQGMARFRVGEFVQTEPYLKANIQLIPETVEARLGGRGPGAQCSQPIRAHRRDDPLHPSRAGRLGDLRWKTLSRRSTRLPTSSAWI